MRHEKAAMLSRKISIIPIESICKKTVFDKEVLHSIWRGFCLAKKRQTFKSYTEEFKRKAVLMYVNAKKDYQIL